MVVVIVVRGLEDVLTVSKGRLADIVDGVEVRIVMLEMRSLMRVMRLVEVRKGILLDVPKIVSANSWRHGAIVSRRWDGERLSFVAHSFACFNDSGSWLDFSLSAF